MPSTDVSGKFHILYSICPPRRDVCDHLWIKKPAWLVKGGNCPFACPFSTCLMSDLVICKHKQVYTFDSSTTWDRTTTHPKFDWVRTHDLQIMTAHFMSLRRLYTWHWLSLLRPSIIKERQAHFNWDIAMSNEMLIIYTNSCSPF